MTHQDPHSHSADAVREHRPIEAQYVRQGRGGRRMLVLLVVSAGAAAILLCLAAPVLAVPVVKAGHGATIEAPAMKKTGMGLVLLVSLRRG